MSIPTYDGSGQAVHPSVVVFEEPWNGYRYWMAMTPYPNSDASKENPSIIASNSPSSGWVVPPGLTNPIEPEPDTGFQSDPELVYADDQLHCIWRWTDADVDTLFLRSTPDGVDWGERQTILTAEGNTIASPGIIWDGSQWVMWTVQIDGSPNLIFRRTAASLAGPWSEGVDCTPTLNPGREPWHLSVLPDPRGGLTMLLHESVADATGGGVGWLRECHSDDGGLTWTPNLQLILMPWRTSSRWDDDRIYRSCGHWLTKDTCEIWYSAAGGATGWHIGYIIASR